MAPTTLSVIKRAGRLGRQREKNREGIVHYDLRHLDDILSAFFMRRGMSPYYSAFVYSVRGVKNQGVQQIAITTGFDFAP